MTTHIVAMGGGGFSTSSNGAPTGLDRYLLDLIETPAPLVCFIPTASADDPVYVNHFLTAYGSLGVRTMVLTLWQGAGDSVQRLPQADIVLVGGGSTVNLLALWDAHDVSRVLRRMARDDRPRVLAGVSAGGACWFEGCITDSFGDLRPWRGGLGLLPGSFCPHLDGENRGPVFTDAVAAGILPGGYAADDGAAVHFVDGELRRVIAERSGATVLRVEPSNEPTASGVLTEVLTPEMV